MLKLVGVAGTFGPLHKGHHLLLHKAFEVGEKVLVALTTDAMLHKKQFREKILPFEERKIKLSQFLDANGYQGRYKIIPLDDPFGVAVTLAEQEGIVTSEDTAHVAEQINEVRLRNGLKLLEIFIIKLVSAEDGQPISSTRIRKNEIDDAGHIVE